MGAFDHEIRALRRIKGGLPEKRVLEKLHGIVKDRIFKEGKDSKNVSLGTYSKGYTERRRKAGVTPIKKVVLRFTGQLRDGFVLIETPKGYESSFLDIQAALKSGWVTSTYKKEIFALTKSEEQILEDMISIELGKVFE